MRIWVCQIIWLLMALTLASLIMDVMRLLFG